MKALSDIDILDTTLRDGNYAVDFQFTARDTQIIALALEKAGFRWIEIGHGLGLNASRKQKGIAAATDEEYLKAVRAVLKKSAYGMFFIPGIGRTRDIEMASDMGMSFIRIGTNADRVCEAKKYMRLAKKLKLTVSSNLMKSYALKPVLLSEKAKEAGDYGADIVCVVDSAGGMLPENIEEYFSEIRKKVSARLGFHGHNNLGLAVANTLRAIEYGATIADASLQGIGRSSGNAPTETLATILKKKYKLPGIDIIKTMDTGEKLVKPFFHKYGISPIDVTLGYAQFHSSFMGKISEAAKEYGVDERELILAVSAKDRLAPSDKLIKTEARNLKEKFHDRLPKTLIVKGMDLDSGGELSGRKTTLQNIVRQISSNSKRTGKLGILNIVFPDQRKGKGLRVSPFIQEDFSYIVGTVEVSNAGHVKKIVDAAEGQIDYILFDSSCATKGHGSLISIARKALKKTGLLIYNDYLAWIDTVRRGISQIAKDPAVLKIAVFGDIKYTLNTAMVLAETGSRVTLNTDKKSGKILNYEMLRPLLRKGMQFYLESDPLKAGKNKDILLGFSPNRPSVTKEMVKCMNPKGIIVDAGLGSVSEDAIAYAYRRNIKVIRVDMRPVIAGEITSSLGIKHLADTHIGKRKLKRKNIVSGGFIGKKGDIVVDSVKNPTKVIGIARGDGMVQYKNLAKYKKDIEKIEKAILAKRMLLES